MVATLTSLSYCKLVNELQGCRWADVLVPPAAWSRWFGQSEDVRRTRESGRFSWFGVGMDFGNKKLNVTQKIAQSTFRCIAGVWIQTWVWVKLKKTTLQGLGFPRASQVSQHIIGYISPKVLSLYIKYSYFWVRIVSALWNIYNIKVCLGFCDVPVEKSLNMIQESLRLLKGNTWEAEGLHPGAVTAPSAPTRVCASFSRSGALGFYMNASDSRL